MWDSSASGISSGKFDGGLIDYGRYDACINIEVANRSLSALNTENGVRRKQFFPAFHGKYASVSLEFKLTELYRMGAKISSKGSSDSSKTNQIMATFDKLESATEPLKEHWNITFRIQGRDRLTDHYDFRMDFASLNITDLLVQEYILVSIREKPHVSK